MHRRRPTCPFDTDCQLIGRSESYAKLGAFHGLETRVLTGWLHPAIGGKLLLTISGDRPLDRVLDPIRQDGRSQRGRASAMAEIRFESGSSAGTWTRCQAATDSAWENGSKL